MAEKYVCTNCGATFDSLQELDQIVVNSRVQKMRRVCPECEAVDGSFKQVEVAEE